MTKKWSEPKGQQNGFGQMISEAKAYRDTHPNDKFWKFHFELSKGLHPVPPIDYPTKKRKQYMKELLKQPNL